MKVTNFSTNRPTMGETRTYEDFYKFLGTRPQRLGIVSSLYPELTASYLTEALRNVFYQNADSGNKYRSIDAMYFEWEVDVNYIKRIPFVEVPEEIGNGEIRMVFGEKYYEQNDIFKIDASEQQCFVTTHPIRKADNYWEYIVRIIDNDYSSSLDFTACQIGMTTRFLSNAFPEMHEMGFVKYQSNIEKHRGYITTHRVDDSYSALYKAHENVFISIGEGKDNGKAKEVTYKMTKLESNLLENFLYVRNNGLLFNRTNVGVDGKPTIYDPDTGRPIYIGDGAIPQIERYASKYFYNKLRVENINTGIQMLNQKANKPTGNHYMFLLNEKAWMDINTELLAWLTTFKTCGTFLWSKEKNSYIKVGGTFNSYEIAGNTVTFHVDRTLSREYGSDKGFMLMVDLTADKKTGEPAIQLFTLKGGDFITNTLAGVGGLDGLSSGPVSSPVAASKVINWGYSGIGVFSPYRSFIMRQV